MRNFTVGRVWGIPIRINVSLVVFLPILAWLIGSGTQIETYAGFIADLTGVGFDVGALRAGALPWVIGVTAAVGLFVSVTLHELGHSWAALRYGVAIESITLWILGGIAALESVPREWDREFFIAVAGPAVSLVVAGVCYAGLLVTPARLQVVRFVVGWLAITNMALTGFNLLPAFPMDGGRIFRALLARSRPYATATRIAARVGVLFAVIFAVVGVLGFNLLLLLLALFIYGAATTESKTVLLDELLAGLTVADVMSRDVATVDADATLADLGDRMLRERRTLYPVTDESGAVVGVVSLSDLGRAGRRDGERTVRDVMDDVVSVAPTDDAFETVVALGRARATQAVVEADDELVGMLSESDLGHALAVRRGVGPRVAQ